MGTTTHLIQPRPQLVHCTTYAGGRVAFAHPESGTAAAYMANTMAGGFGAPDPRWAWIGELRKAVAA